MAEKNQLPILSIHRPANPSIRAGQGRLKKKDRPKPTAKNPLIISASELKTFLRCRVKWHWRHQVRIEPTVKPKALYIGGVTHKIIDPWYMLDEEKRTVKAMRRIANKILMVIPPDELSIEDVELIKAMVTGYAKYAKSKDPELKMKGIQTESFFDLPLTPGGEIRVRGYIDVMFQVGAYRRTMGCMEHKTAKNIRHASVDTNIQLSIYLWALRQMKPKMKRYIAYRNVLRKQLPGPRVKAALFDRQPIERTDDEIDQWALDVGHAALDMLDAAIYPNPMDSCSWDCDYQVPCLLRGNEDDLTHVLETSFKQKESRHGTTVLDEEEEED